MSDSRLALICGISGQDGAYLAQFLISKGYTVAGTSRNQEQASFENLRRLGILERVKIIDMMPSDLESVRDVVRTVKPREIYNVSAQSSVGLSFEQPRQTVESIVEGTANLLETIRSVSPFSRYYSSSSGDCFGHTGENAACETSAFSPTSPYGAAKVAAHALVEMYRQTYGIYACEGFVFNHESPLRASRFVLQKVARSTASIAAAGGVGEVQLGDLNIVRDWGWAPEYVDPMWRMLQRQTPADYVIATGRSVSLKTLVDSAFRFHGLQWADHVRLSLELTRSSDIAVSRANPDRAKRELNWTATVTAEEVIARMCDAARNELSNSTTTSS